MLNLPITRDGFVWALSISSQIHHVPVTTTMVLQKYEPPFTLGSFRAVAEQCGFKVKQKAVPNSQLAKLPLPCLITLIPGIEGISTPENAAETVLAADTREYQMALLQSVDEDLVVLAKACSKSTITLSRKAFEKCFAGEVLIVIPAPTENETPHDEKGKQMSIKKNHRVGISWLLPDVGWFKAMFRGIR